MTATLKETRHDLDTSGLAAAGPADRPGAGPGAAAPVIVTPDTDGRWTLVVGVLVLIFCVAVWFGLLYAFAPTAFDPDWAGFGPYRGWEVRP